MTVAELIEFLEGCDPEALVLSMSNSMGDREPVAPSTIDESDCFDYVTYYPRSGPSLPVRPGMVIL